MEHRNRLEQLNKEALERFDEYVKTKKDISADDHEKIHAAKDEWQVAWTKLQEAMLVLERLEI